MSAFKLIISIDVGNTGAIALLADGQFDGVHDMPTSPRLSGGVFVDSFKLAEIIRSGIRRHPTASVLGIIERVQAMPKNGASSMFKFGEGYGVCRGVLGALGVGYTTIRPQDWKRHHGLIGTDKDASRRLAIQKFPTAHDLLKLKKHDGRADAICVGLWAHETDFAL